MRIQAKRRPPTRRQVSTDDTVPSFEDDTVALFHEATSTVESGPQASDAKGAIGRGSHSFSVADVLSPLSVVDAISRRSDNLETEADIVTMAAQSGALTTTLTIINHGLNGSSSPVLTATSLTYGEAKNLTPPTESKPMNQL